MDKHTILVVDDEVDNVDALERHFRKKHYVLKATSGPEALKLLENNSVSLIISDQRMPEMTGVELLKRSMESHPDAIRILLTGYTDIESVIDSINSGQVYRYINKPWDPVDLSNTVEKALEKLELRSELKKKNAALENALEELKSLDEAKNHFMILVNHELKTPLTGIVSFLHLLQESDLSEEQSLFVERIGQNTNRLQRLINDVMQIVSAETGQMKLNKEKVKIKTLIDPVLSEKKASAEEKGQTLKCECLASLTGTLDPEYLKTVLQHLIDNAIKFGVSDSTVKIRVEKQTEGLSFSIENQGPSIPSSTVQKILQPFALDENIMNHTEGLGLGLSVSQAILKQHNSSLEFSEQEGNIRVSFQLPKS